MPLSFNKHSRKASASSIGPIFTPITPVSPTFSISSAVSTISSTSTSLSSPSRRHSRILNFNPLSSHPVYTAPPRLHERPFLFTPSTPRHPSSTISVRSVRNLKQLTVVHAVKEESFFDEDEDEDEDDDEEEELSESESEEEMNAANASLLDKFYSSPTEEEEIHVLRSRWSASTIASDISSDAESIFSHNDASDTESDVFTMSLPTVTNFSWKREMAPAKKVEESPKGQVRRGGWKRCGVIFGDETTGQVSFVKRHSAPNVS